MLVPITISDRRAMIEPVREPPGNVPSRNLNTPNQSQPSYSIDGARTKSTSRGAGTRHDRDQINGRSRSIRTDRSRERRRGLSPVRVYPVLPSARWDVANPRAGEVGAAWLRRFAPKLYARPQHAGSFQNLDFFILLGPFGPLNSFRADALHHAAKRQTCS